MTNKEFTATLRDQGQSELLKVGSAVCLEYFKFSDGMELAGPAKINKVIYREKDQPPLVVVEPTGEYKVSWPV